MTITSKLSSSRGIIILFTNSLFIAGALDGAHTGCVTLMFQDLRLVADVMNDMAGQPDSTTCEERRRQLNQDGGALGGAPPPPSPPPPPHPRGTPCPPQPRGAPHAGGVPPPRDSPSQPDAPHSRQRASSHH